MSELHVYLMISGPDLVIAADVDDAWNVWSEHTGEKRDDYLDEDFESWADDKQLTIDTDDGEPETKTGAEWATTQGRGFLASSEW